MTEPARTTVRARPTPHIVTELPGPRARAHIALDELYVTPSLPRVYRIVPVRGEGSMVEDIDGNRFLDFAAGIAVNSTGHCHPDVVAAIAEQAATLIHCASSDYYLPVYMEVARELDRIAPISGPTRAFLCNSGAEAVESAMKLARYATGRQAFIAFLGAFHGRTYGAVSVTGSRAKYRAQYAPLLPGVYHVPFGDAGIDELEQRVFRRLVPANEVAAIFVEPIQGEGGYVVPEPDFLPRLRCLCDEHGILLVADEIQSGMGRTGKWWAIEHWGVEPDVLLTAKGIASGLPLGAMIARSELMSWPAGAHGSTFGGNPVSCAAALVTIRLIEREYMANAAARGEQLMEGLRQLFWRHDGLVRDVRGRGLMIGIEFDSGRTANAVEEECFQRGLLVLTAGDVVVRVSPALSITAEEAATGLRIFGEAVAAVEARG
ncbi:MAG TPA: aminotransferase class III-fold pyridoxal phosphate-dependent enzyme [Candidatus Acidoferrales bacterium]|nr:aminotransferase class III-fold pyridoxal phosphate-dependent enzyme [Candidatus Acidoferrales bacterium]